MTKQVSIGDFAMSLIEQNKDEYKRSTANGLPVSIPTPDGPDLSKIQVDEATVTDIFARSFGIKKKLDLYKNLREWRNELSPRRNLLNN